MDTLKKGDNKIIATKSSSLRKSAFNETNCEIIFEVGQYPKSWNPSHSLNSLTKFEKGKTYLIRLKEDVELLGKL